MARNRAISPDFWTWEAVIDRTPMTRLLFLGLWNFADDHGVQPLRPRTGAEIMANHSNPSPEDGQGPRTALADEGPARPTPATESMANHSNPSPDDGQGPRTALADEGPSRLTAATKTMANHSNPSPALREVAWRAAIDDRPHRAQIEMIDEIAQGCDFRNDIVPVVRDFCTTKPFCGPPVGFQQLDEGVARNRVRHEEQVSSRATGNSQVTASQSFDRSRHTIFAARDAKCPTLLRREADGRPRVPGDGCIVTKGVPRMAALTVNGKTHQVNVDPRTPLLWVLRDTIGLTGTKYGCGIAQCGACTVHIDGVATRSCQVPLSSATGNRKITTIEGLAANGVLSKVQKAWLEHDVPQCGYCQSGMIMAAAALLKDKPKPTDSDIDAVMTNICRCGTYQQVRAAIHAAAKA